jgi:hypothetical protein
MLPAERRQHILNTLANQGSVQIDAISRDLGVSTMTVHRDLDQLERAGQLRKVRGGAIPVAGSKDQDVSCVTCQGPSQERLRVILLHQNGQRQRACCPHCGLIAMATNSGNLTGALVTDFLYGHMVSAQEASYLVAPEITLCCTPTILAFETPVDAQCFQAGFGGQLMSLQSALQYLLQQTRVPGAL